MPFKTKTKNPSSLQSEKKQSNNKEKKKKKPYLDLNSIFAAYGL